MSKVEAASLLRLVYAAGLIPLAWAMFSIFLAGRVLTHHSERSKLGTWLARLCLSIAVMFVSTTGLIFNRWYNLNPKNEGSIDLTIFLSAVSLMALISALISAHVVIPIITARIMQGRTIIQD